MSFRRRPPPTIRTRLKKAAAINVDTRNYAVTYDPAYDETLISTDITLGRSQDHSESWIKDSLCKGDFRYQDCSHQHFTADYGVPDVSLQQRVPHLEFFHPGNLELKHIVHVGRIFQDLSQQYGRDFNVLYPHTRIEAWLGNWQLPTHIILDRDPFDSDFSVWFLVADVLLIPGLVRQIFNRPIIRRSELAGRRTLKQLADDDLMVKFGILATYRDLVDFVGIINRFLRGFEEFVKAGKTYRWHSHVTNVSSAVPLHPPRLFTWQGHATGARSIFVESYLESCHHYRTMAYRIVAPELTSWLSRMRQFVDLFGVLDPAALWDVIPFSFVADWFFDIGGWLTKNKPRLFKGQVSVHDYCESIKIKYSHEYFAGPTDSPGPDNPSIGEESHCTYIRRRFQPDVSDLLTHRGHPLLSIRQAQIAASLVAQRIPRAGQIGDWFEGVDFGQDHLPINGTTAAADHATNKAWADQQRQRKAALAGGVYPSLRSFELSPSAAAAARKEDAAKQTRLPRQSKRGQVQFVPMRKSTWADLRNQARTAR